jgi:hypothetical protein
MGAIQRMARLNNHRNARARMMTKPDAGRYPRILPKPKRRERSKPHPQISAILNTSQPTPAKQIAQKTISDHISKTRADERRREFLHLTVYALQRNRQD